MSDWDKRYREGFYSGSLHPHPLVSRFWNMVPSGSPVIDIAMGTGRDLFLFAEKGWFCCGLDRSWEGIKMALQEASGRGLQIFPTYGDAYRLPFRKGSAGAVLVFYFLVREIMHELTSLLRPGGILMYETFLQTQNTIDRFRNPDYQLHDGELIGYFTGFDLLFYEEGTFLFQDKKRAIARYVGRKR
ncbi:MAG TPA: class I SAM-dependent methyltransferase [Syntrophorhabdales bacterium]|nr:class I SAM-dependent methyltransferase [Syntrophorhabdales bacterium]